LNHGARAVVADERAADDGDPEPGHSGLAFRRVVLCPGGERVALRRAVDSDLLEVGPRLAARDGERASAIGEAAALEDSSADAELAERRLPSVLVRPAHVLPRRAPAVVEVDVLGVDVPTGFGAAVSRVAALLALDAEDLDPDERETGDVVEAEPGLAVVADSRGVVEAAVDREVVEGEVL